MSTEDSSMANQFKREYCLIILYIIDLDLTRKQGKEYILFIQRSVINDIEAIGIFTVINFTKSFVVII